MSVEKRIDKLKFWTDKLNLGTTFRIILIVLQVSIFIQSVLTDALSKQLPCSVFSPFFSRTGSKNRSKTNIKWIVCISSNKIQNLRCSFSVISNDTHKNGPLQPNGKNGNQMRRKMNWIMKLERCTKINHNLSIAFDKRYRMSIIIGLAFVWFGLVGIL